MRVSENKIAVLTFDHNSKLACNVHECHHHMDIKNIEVVGHEAHYHQRLFLEAWMSVKKTRMLGIITWSSQKSTSAEHIQHAQHFILKKQKTTLFIDYVVS